MRAGRKLTAIKKYALQQGDFSSFSLWAPARCNKEVGVVLASSVLGWGGMKIRSIDDRLKGTVSTIVVVQKTSSKSSLYQTGELANHRGTAPDIP